MDQSLQNAYTSILKEELISAIGCNAPISVALCAATAQQALGMQPTAATVSVSAGIQKNAKNVVVPHTGGLKGICAAVAAGIVCGDASRGRRVLSAVTEEQRAAIVHMTETMRIDVVRAETDSPIYISVTLYARTSYARAVIANDYTNVTEVMKNGEVLFARPLHAPTEDRRTDRACLRFADILDYADQADLDAVKDLLDLQIESDMAIAEAGMDRTYGDGIGRLLLSSHSDDAQTEAKAYAAAASDARTGGCELPIAFLCGSGSRGIAAIIPVICYARRYAISEERMRRALLAADLLTVYAAEQSGAHPNGCSAIDAGCAVGAALAYLLGKDRETAARAFLHTLNLRTDMLCDGANASCSLKIAAAIDVGILGFLMAQRKPEAPADALLAVDALLRRA